MKVVIHYAEIALKGKNRPFYEKKLIQNIKTSFRKNGLKLKSVEQQRLRIVLESDESQARTRDALANVFGIRYFAFVESCGSDMNEIKKTAVRIMNGLKEKSSIALLTKRSDKSFPMTSVEVNKVLGEEARTLGFKIDFGNPQHRLHIEITSRSTEMYLEKTDGLAGLPVGTSGKVLVLLSGGIDSAVAAWLMMKRGCEVDFMHFHTFQDNKEVMKTKIKSIIDVLNRHQASSRLFLIPYHNYQLMTMGRIPDKLDVVVFKNFMLRLAQEIAVKEKYQAIVTGDSLGQVASQTLQNIAATGYGIDIEVLRPLLGFDKQEIVNLATKIRTYGETIRDYKDCCSIIARKPATAVSLDKIKKALENFDVHNVMQKSFKEMEVFEIK